MNDKEVMNVNTDKFEYRYGEERCGIYALPSRQQVGLQLLPRRWLLVSKESVGLTETLN